MANRGQAIEILDENNNILYPRTNANNVYFGDTGKMVGTVLGDAVVDIGNLQTKTNNLDTEVSEARNSQTVNYPNLKTRLDAMDNRIGQGGSYYRIGNQITVYASLGIDSSDTASGEFRIAGLPMLPNNSSGGADIGLFTHLNTPANTELFGVVYHNEPFIRFSLSNNKDLGIGASWLTIDNVGTATIVVSATYRVG